jgi:hypothetical protein
MPHNFNQINKLMPLNPPVYGHYFRAESHFSNHEIREKGQKKLLEKTLSGWESGGLLSDSVDI